MPKHLRATMSAGMSQPDGLTGSAPRAQIFDA
jgi:hypothetical protein